jgi:hypothetical protein
MNTYNYNFLENPLKSTHDELMMQKTTNYYVFQKYFNLESNFFVETSSRSDLPNHSPFSLSQSRDIVPLNKRIVTISAETLRTLKC